MNILPGLAPFLAFVVLGRTLGVEPGTLAGAVVASVLVLREVLGRRTPKLREAGTVVLSGGLAACGAVAGADWSVVGVRPAVDAGLLAIVLVSMAVGRSFPLQYARERAGPALWDDPRFLRVNAVITSVCGAAMVAVDAAWVAVAGTPPWVVAAATVLALLGAIRFTEWYPRRVRARATAAAP